LREGRGVADSRSNCGDLHQEAAEKPTAARPRTFREELIQAVQLFSESNEPPFDELSLEEFKEKFPEGGTSSRA